ncbi:hypothetical protein FRC01_007996 [Tulasnella sp. 417]|nr:hypothetical protein FRC01_007996 [Tulasnella sp. 417]
MAESSAFVVKAPFNDSPTGDCILQTPDGTEFVVHRLILSLASPIWSDMFSLPQASEGASSTRPVIPVEEDPETMEALLTMVYPIPPPRINSYDLATKLVQACDKYFIDVSRLDATLYKVFRTTAALEADPLGVYALAWRLGMDEEAKVASRYTHRLDLNDPKVQSDLIRRSGSVKSLVALWDLRLRRECALDDLTKLAELKRYSDDPICSYHSVPYTFDSGWLAEKHLRAKSSAKRALLEPYPRRNSPEELFGVSLSCLSTCAGCQMAKEKKYANMARSVNVALDAYPQTITKDSPGDCIIQTAGGTQFVVYRVILSLASSVWNDMFSLPQSSEASSSERPVIPVDEDPETLEVLLTMLYPMQPPRIESYDLAIKLVQACDKYFINMSRLSTFLHDVLRATTALESNPLGVYALAWKLKMGEEAKIASRYTHRLDLYNQAVVEELINRTGGLEAVMVLWDLRRRREAALDGLARLMELDEALFWCSSHQKRNEESPSDIVFRYLRVRSSVKAALENPYPTCKGLEQFFGHSVSYESYRCENCKQAAERKLRAIIDSTIEAIEKFPQTIKW